MAGVHSGDSTDGSPGLCGIISGGVTGLIYHASGGCRRKEGPWLLLLGLANSGSDLPLVRSSRELLDCGSSPKSAMAGDQGVPESLRYVCQIL